MITIGRKSINDIQLDHPAISGEAHLKVEVTNSGKMIYHHHGRNNTLVNGISIKKKIIQNDDVIKIGEFTISGEDLISKVTQTYYKSKTDFSTEFKTIIPLLEEYEIKKEKILRPSIAPKVIRIGLSVALIIGLIVFNEKIPANLRIVMFALVGVIATALSGIGANKSSKKKKLDDINLEYNDDLKCPKCKIDLSRKSAYFLIGNKKCINNNCDVKFEYKI